MPYSLRLLSSAAIAMAGLAACVGPSPRDALPHDADAATRALAETADDLERLAADTPAATPAPTSPAAGAEIIGRGFAQVGTQPGHSLNERRLLAIRAAKMEAYRDLVEQVHGIAITSNSNLRDAALADDRIAALVSGEIRGARTVSIRNLDADSFEVVLALSPDTVRYILRAARMGI